MKRSKIKLEEITDVENCKRAILHASKRKRRRSNVRHILEHIDEYAEKLRAFLMDKNAEFNEGIYQIINEGTHKKRRELCKPIFFPDQCAHWAIMQIVFPVLEKSFDRYTCASIKGRGTHYAKLAVERFLKDTKNTKYCLQIDVKSFYASIDKGILTELLRRKIKDPRIVGLLEKVIIAYKGDGLPLGWYTSAPLANFYLSGLDRYIKHNLRVKYMVRYMDDVVMYGSNKRHLHRARVKIAEYIERRRRCRLKANWQVYRTPYDNGKGKITTQRATDFVGFKFYRYKTTIRKSIFLRLTRLMRRLWKGYNIHRAYAFMSYRGYVMSTDSANVSAKYIDGKISVKTVKEIIRNESRKQIASYGKASIA